MTTLTSLARALPAAGLILLASCATTTPAPPRTARFDAPPLRSVVVCAQTTDVATQRMVEDAFVRALSAHGVSSVECHNVLPPGQPSSWQMRGVVAHSGADGLIVASSLNVKAIEEYGGPAQTAPGFASGPDVFSTEIGLQAKAYSAARLLSYPPSGEVAPPPGGAMTWTTTTRTDQPSTVRRLVGRAVPNFLKAMVAAGVIPPAQAVSQEGGQGQPSSSSGHLLSNVVHVRTTTG